MDKIEFIADENQDLIKSEEQCNYKLSILTSQKLFIINSL